MPQFVLNALTLSNVNRFSKFFHCQNQEKICNSIISKDPTTSQVCRYTTLWNVTKSWFRLACQEWRRLASSSSSRGTRLTANITVNMFSLAVYYPTSVIRARCQRYSWTLQQDGAPSHTARNTLTYVPAAWERHVHRARHVTPNSPDLNPVDYAVWGALQQMVYQRWRFTTINQLKQAIVIEWGKLSQRFIDRAIWSVASPAWVRRPAARRTQWTFVVKNCVMWQVL